MTDLLAEWFTGTTDLERTKACSIESCPRFCKPGEILCSVHWWEMPRVNRDKINQTRGKAHRAREYAAAVDNGLEALRNKLARKGTAKHG